MTPILPGVSIRLIQQLVARRYKIPEASMTSTDRGRTSAYPRQLAMALSREFTNKTLPAIGRHFGGRDHTTVIHARKAVKRRAERDLETAAHLTFMRALLDQMRPKPIAAEPKVTISLEDMA